MALSQADCEEMRAALQSKATNYRYLDLARWLKRAGGWTLEGERGTHRTWVHATGRQLPLVEPGHGEVLPVYVKETARAILETGGCPE